MAETETRRSRQPDRSSPAEASDEQSEDLSTGQIVIIAARWFLIATGLVVTLWAPAEGVLNQVRIAVFVLLAIAVGNFFLHAQILMRRPVHSGIVYLASAVDIGVITLITWAFGGGVESTLFVYYYPALLAFALVFPLGVTLTFTVVLLAVYSLVSFPGAATQDLQIWAVRLISMLAVAVVGNWFQRIERGRREALAAVEADRALLGRS